MGSLNSNKERMTATEVLLRQLQPSDEAGNDILDIIIDTVFDGCGFSLNGKRLTKDQVLKSPEDILGGRNE